MRVADSFRLSFRIFTTRPKRTLLTILGVGIGIAAVLFLVSIGYGIQKVIIGTISTADSLLSLDVTPGSSAALTIDQEAVDTIAHSANVVEVDRQKNIAGQIGFGDLTTDTVIRAIDRGYFRLSGIAPASGTLLTEAKDNDVVLSSGTVKLLGLTPESALEKKITLTLIDSPVDEIESTVTTVQLPSTFTIRGIITDDAVSYAYVTIASIPEFPVDTFDSVKVKVSSQEAGVSVRDEIVTMGFVVSALSDVISQANQIFRIVQIVLAALGLIALLVSAIGMFNTMTIALLERTNEIGIMRSIGVTRADVQKLFITEAMVMGFLGGVGGIVMGIVAGTLVNIGFGLLAHRLGGIAVNIFVVPWWFVGVILGFSTIIGFLTGIFPALRASKMDPLEALRYK